MRRSSLSRSPFLAVPALVGLLLAASWWAAAAAPPSGALAATSRRAVSSEPVWPGASWSRIGVPEQAGYSASALEELRSYVGGLSTTGLMVVVGGRVLFEHGDVRQLSYLASVRKSILAMLYGRYVVDGTIDLARTLADVGLSDHGGLLPIEQEATIEHLITARSGVYHAASNGGDSSADAPPRGSQRPGAFFLYNNWDFNAAGAVFERLTGRDIYDALAELAADVDLQDFDRRRQRKSGNLDASMYPAYHIWLSTRDMARIGYLMLRQGSWNGRQVVPGDWARRVVSVVTPLAQMNPEPMRQGQFGYGYMWWVWDGPRARGPWAGAYAARGAYGQYIAVLPVLDMVVAHKTAVPPPRQTPWSDFQGILDRLVAARCRTACE